MKKLKNIVTMLSVLCCSLLCMCVIVGCSNNEDKNSTPTQTDHNWSITYTDNGDQHYQTCDGCDEKKYSDHNYTNGNCVCGKENPNSVPTPSAKVLKVDGASVDGNKIVMLVDHSVDSVSLADKVVCSSDSAWRLYYDKLGQIEIPTKMATSLNGELSNGNNFFYIVVTSQNGELTSLYELIVHRSYAVNINFYNNDLIIKTGTAYTGNDYTVSYTPNIDGYTFNYWESETGDKADYSFTVWADVNFYANKTAKQYTANFDVNGGDELQTETQATTYDSNYIFATPTRAGYSFLGWYDEATQVTDKNGISFSVWNYTQNKTLIAKWKANTYTLTAVSDNPSGGTVSGSGEYGYDSTVALTATTNVGYTFIGWYDENNDNVSSNLECSVIMEFDATYTAKWIKVTPISANTAMGTVSTLAGTYMPGDSATVTATTKSGYTFIGWYNGDIKLTGELNYTFVMPSTNMTYTAKWIQVNVRINMTGAGTVSTPTGTFMPGDSATVKVTATNIGYTFIGWYNGDIMLTDESSYTFTMPSVNTTYAAKWEIVDEMDNFTFTSSTTACKITGVKNRNVSEVVVPNYVTSIGDNAFSKCSGLTSITIPNSVTWIGLSAFFGCCNLTKITIPNSVTIIRDNAFNGCSSLASINMSNSLTDICSGTFFGCSSLISITIPNGVTSIRKNAFGNCSKLTSVILPNSVGYIEDTAFYGCSNLQYNEYDNALYLGNRDNPYVVLIKSKNLDITSCQIHIDTNIIYYRAFIDCSQLTNITIPDKVTSIGSFAFSGCNSLKRVAFIKTHWTVWDSVYTSLDSSELENESAAAEYLTSTYKSWRWSVRY